MHECPDCGMVCDCDSDDTWDETYGRRFGGPRCTHDCDDDDFDDVDYDDVDYDEEDDDETDPHMPGWRP